MVSGSGPTIIAFPGQNFGQQQPSQVGFERVELARILDLYGRMVAAGEWRDYAMDFTRDCALFAAFRRTADVPQMRLEKRPALRNKQGMWALFGEHGQVLKRGHELANVLAPMERKLVKAVDS
jgi:hypothetical protein